jgi:hypothetical protein
VIPVTERLLREDAGAAPTALICIAVATVGSALFGLALGASSGHPMLALFALLKLPLLLACTTSLCLPPFYVVHCVLGLRDDFGAALRGMLAAQATFGIALAALAPMVPFLTLSLADPYALTLLDGVLCALGTAAAHHVLGRHYRPLIARDARHRLTLRGWLVLYGFAGIQVAWVLRPFRGSDGFAVEFLRTEAFEQNAWLVLIEHAVRLWR